MYFRAPKTWTRRVPSFLVKMAYGNVVHWVKVKTIMWRKNALILTGCFPTSGSQAWLSCLYCIRNLTWSKVLQLLGFKLACSENIVVVRITNIYTFLQSKLWILQPSAVGGHAAPVPQQALQSIITTIRCCTVVPDHYLVINMCVVWFFLQFLFSIQTLLVGTLLTLRVEFSWVADFSYYKIIQLTKQSS